MTLEQTSLIVVGIQLHTLRVRIERLGIATELEEAIAEIEPPDVEVGNPAVSSRYLTIASSSFFFSNKASLASSNRSAPSGMTKIPGVFPPSPDLETFGLDRSCLAARSSRRTCPG